MNLIKLSINRPIFITCIFILIIAVGLLSLFKLPVDLFPDVTFPVVTVTTPYPGAGPKEVETLVSKVLENELSSIAGIKTLRSVNKESVSQVIAEFNLSVDVKYAEQQVRDRVSSARRKLPDDADDSTIRRIDPSDQPILSVSVVGSGTQAQTYDFANEEIRPLLQQVNQVGQVEILGGRKREIQVELDQNRLRDHQITATQVANYISAAGQNIPAGKVSSEKDELVYRTLAEFRSLEEIESTIVSFFANETPIRVRDLGKVKDALEDEKSRVSFNGNRSLVLLVYKQSGSNTIQVVDTLKKKIAQINTELKNNGRNFELSVIRDNSKAIRANVADVNESIIIGIILTIIVVLFFLGNMRSTFITSLALPSSLLGAFILMSFAGFTINIMSLLALSLAVGLLIDDAIVVRENIFRHIEMGKTPRRAAEEGTLEVTLAVIATTMTVIAVFGPIGFLSGVVGQFFKEFGLTVCFAMAISLLDALTMAPMMSTYFAGQVHAEKDSKPSLYDRSLGVLLKKFDRFQSYLEDVYEKSLHWTLKFPKSAIFGGIIIFVVSIFMLKFVPKTFTPPQDNGEFQVRIELEPGTSLDKTSVVAKAVEEQIRSNKEVDSILTIAGNRDGESNLASFTIILIPSKLRKGINTSQMKDILRQQLSEKFAYAKPIVSDIDGVGGGQRPLNLVITGNDLKQLEEYATKIFAALKVHPALKDPEISIKPGKPEFQIVLDPDRAERYGVSTKVAGAELRTLVEGTVPSVLRQNGIEYDIRVRSQADQRDLQSRLDYLFVPNINNRPVSIKAVAATTKEVGPATINRQNRNRAITISADIAPNGPGMGGAITDIKKLMSVDHPLPAGITYSFSGQAESFQELLINMIVAMGLGILFIYLVLASLYESFVTPFTIMLVLPLALCGAFIALFVSGKTLDLFSMIGCVMLLGVATKNSILLVDYTNQLMKDGVERSKAIVQAGRTRLRPILMTSFALISGMLPVAIGLNEASKQRTSMGVAIIGGLISSTLLTLIIVPAAFPYLDSFGNWINRQFRKISSPKGSSPIPVKPLDAGGLHDQNNWN